MKRINSVLILIFVTLFLTSCEKSEEAMVFTLSVECTAATDCGDNTANAKTLSVAVVDASQTCTSPPSTFVATGTGTILCAAGVCTASVTAWTDVTATGTLSILVAIDTDSNGTGGELNEPIGCQNNINFTSGETVIMNEASMDGSVGWIDGT